MFEYSGVCVFMSERLPTGRKSMVRFRVNFSQAGHPWTLYISPMKASMVIIRV